MKTIKRWWANYWAWYVSHDDRYDEYDRESWLW